MLLPPGLTPIEAAAGIPFGGPPAPRRGSAGVVPDVFAALVASFAEPVRSGPCAVWLSGDDGTAVVMAAAVEAARRAGADPPIAVTPWHASVPADPFAETLVRHLGIEDWRRPEIKDELGLLGPVARDALRRHGPMFPSIAHLFVPLLREARGGTLLSGHALNEWWVLWRGAAVARALRRRRFRRSDLQALAALAPLPVRRRLATRIAAGMDIPYLLPGPRAEATRLAVDDLITTPLGADAAARLAGARACIPDALGIYDRLAADHDARFVFALAAPPVVDAMAAQFGRLGCSGPGQWRRRVAPSLPPRTVPAVSPSYAHIWKDADTRAFIEAWDGSGVDVDLVDPEALRAAWRRGDWRSGILLQSAWLYADRRAGAR